MAGHDLVADGEDFVTLGELSWVVEPHELTPVLEGDVEHDHSPHNASKEQVSNGFTIWKCSLYMYDMIMACEKYLQAGVQKVGTAGTAGAGQITFGWTKWDLDAEKNWTYYGKSKEILPHSDKLDIWIFNKWYKHFFQ